MKLDNILPVILASGHSTRFGSANKLFAPLAALPLGLHVARTLRVAGFNRLCVIVPDGDDKKIEKDNNISALYKSIESNFVDIDIIANPRRHLGQGTSVALAACQASREAMDGVLIALADMPFVPVSHIHALCHAARPENITMTETIIPDASRRHPPGVFGHRHFDALMGFKHDHNGRDYVMSQSVVTSINANPRDMMDVDTRDDLKKAIKYHYEQSKHQGEASC